MIYPKGDLTFEQAHDIFSAFFAGSQNKQAEKFGELSLEDRKMVVRAIEVLDQNKDKLLKEQYNTPSYLDKDDPLMDFVIRLQNNQGLCTDGMLLTLALKEAKPLAIQGRAEIVLANRFWGIRSFLKPLEKVGNSIKNSVNL